MPARLLVISSSPRGATSATVAVTDAFVARYGQLHPDTGVDRLDVWAEDLPDFDGHGIGAKYKAVSGEEMDPGERRVADAIAGLVDRFRRADRIVVGVPMWNWSLPYKLKHLIDLVCQRDALFTFDGTDYGPALDVERALVVGARGQGHGAGFAPGVPGPPGDQLDYVRFWLRVIGVREVLTLAVERSWDGVGAPSVEPARDAARRLAETF